MSWAGYLACKREDRKLYSVWWESPKERDHSEDRGVDGRMGSEWILGRLAGGVEWIKLAQNIGRWRAVVNEVMRLNIYKFERTYFGAQYWVTSWELALYPLSIPLRRQWLSEPIPADLVLMGRRTRWHIAATQAMYEADYTKLYSEWSVGLHQV
jgi:hypothetical protein